MGANHRDVSCLYRRSGQPAQSTSLGVISWRREREFSRGLRWLESAVQQAVRDMYNEAQPKPKTTRRPRPKPVCGLAGMSTDDIYRLTTGQCVQ